MYQSPTDMGVNRAGYAIVDDDAARHAGKQEILRRYFRYACDAAAGLEDHDSVRRIEMLMEEFSIKDVDRPVVGPAREAAEQAAAQQDMGHRGVVVGTSLELPDGRIVTAKNSPQLHAAAALVLNAVKALAELPDELDLISPATIAPIRELRRDILGRDSISLNVEETMIALSISSTTNPTAQRALKELANLRGLEMHMTHLPPPGDERGLRRLGVRLTCDPRFATDKLFAS